jgi:hypothetical protein
MKYEWTYYLLMNCVNIQVAVLLFLPIALRNGILEDIPETEE